MNDLHRYQDVVADLVESPTTYPEGRFAGAGIVTCAGGRSYFPCAWVLVNVLRDLGCQLPIEVWHRGAKEMNPRMQSLLESVDGVRCMDASQGHPPLASALDGWEIKPYAIIHSSFEHVLFLDCDNVPVRDPSFVLDSRPYRRRGAAFWPDRWMTCGDHDKFRTIAPEAWEAVGLDPRDEPEFESGQLAVHKRRCWHALQLTMFLNERSQFFYGLLLGDKDTFHLAWRRLGQDYAMPPFRPAQDWDDGPVLYQHDFHGRRLFQHRNQDKWAYDGGNATIPGFVHEERCFEHLERLRRLWDGVVRAYPDDYTSAERRAVEALTRERLFRYAHLGGEQRLIEFRPDFSLGVGRAKWETAWGVEEADGGSVKLTLRNGMRRMCVLRRNGGPEWKGRCLHFDRLPIVLEPVSCLYGEEQRVGHAIRDLLERGLDPIGPHAAEIAGVGSFLYHRVGYDARPMDFACDLTIRRGAAPRERWWYIDTAATPPRLVICGDDGPTCALGREATGVWAGQWLAFEKMPVELLPGAEALRSSDLPYYTRDYYAPISATRDYYARDYYAPISATRDYYARDYYATARPAMASRSYY